MYVDAHCHLDFAAFDADRSAVLERARAVGVTQLVVAGVRPDDWARQRALAGPDIAWTAGLHPEPAAQGGDALARTLAGLDGAFSGARPACAIGEIGLDRRYRAMEVQEAAFRAQLAAARARRVPVVLHVVGRHGRALALAEADGIPAAGALVHAFSGSAEVAERWVRLGAHLSFGAALAYAKRAPAALRATPLERLLLETDAPDQPLPGDTRNEPAALVRVGEVAAQIRGEPAEPLMRAAAANARALFGLPRAGDSWQLGASKGAPS